MTGDWDATIDDLAARHRPRDGGRRQTRPTPRGRPSRRSQPHRGLARRWLVHRDRRPRRAAPADALVAGVGRIDGRPVAVGAEDFTTLGGSIGPAASRKRWRIADIARRERIPLVMLLEGAGHRPPMPGDPGGGGPGDLGAQGSLSGLVPMVCGVMGSSAGHGAITAPCATSRS